MSSGHPEMIAFFEQWALTFEIMLFITVFASIMLIAFIIYSFKKEKKEEVK